MRFLLISFILTLSADIAFACSCGPKPPVLDSYNRSAVVVIARVLSVEVYKDERDNRRGVKDEDLDRFGEATLVVEKVYKGRLRVNEEFKAGGAPNAACIWSFHEQTVGHRFLLYLFDGRQAADFWWTSTCGRSRGLEYATEDLLYLDNITKLRGKTRVSGNYGGFLNSELEDVANKTIRIVGEKQTYETKTDTNGVYEIYDLPPGSYVVEPEVPKGWQIARYSGVSAGTTSLKALQFTLEANKHVSVNVRLEPSNSVEGSVVGPDGNPMKGVCAYLLKSDQQENEFACTDKNGHFRIEAVPAGSYHVVLNPGGKVSTDAPFSRLFYPSVTQREKAALITIANGDTVRGIDFLINSLAETVTVSGVLKYSDGKPAAEELVNFSAIAKPGIDGDLTEMTDTRGRFTFQVLKGLKGEIYADFEAEIGEYEKCPRLDALIRATGQEFAEIRTSSIKIEAERDIANLVLQFPFPRCKRIE